MLINKCCEQLLYAVHSVQLVPWIQSSLYHESKVKTWTVHEVAWFWCDCVMFQWIFHRNQQVDSLFSNLYYVFFSCIYCLFLFLETVVSSVCIFVCFTIYCTQNTGERITAIHGLWIDTIVRDESDGLPTDWFLNPYNFT